jgi:thiosulfate reductase/polysulfide reductase chain A
MVTETKRAVCEHCHARCRVLVHSENGRLKGFEEDRSYPLWDQIHPATMGCTRLHGAKEMMYHPDRVNFPLRRAGEKGEGKWEVISWDDALDEIAAKLEQIKQKYGAESLAISTGTWRTRDFQCRFANLFGTPNWFGQSNICYGPWIATSTAMYGWPHRPRVAMRLVGAKPGEKVEDKCILMVGSNFSQSYLRPWKSIRDAKNSGFKLIVIDPRETDAARMADLWLQLRPGTDTALMMSMANVIIEEDLYDKDFVEKWCYGFDELRERARKYPPEKAAEITWVDADKIREAARICGRSKPLYTVHGMGLEHLQNAIDAIQSRLILAAITGSIDVEGGHYISGPAECRSNPEFELIDRLPPEQKHKQIGSDRFKLQGLPGFELMLQSSLPVWKKPYSILSCVANAHAPSVYRAMLTGEPYPVRAALSTHSNPMVTQGNTRLVYKALKSLDLYVVFDLWRTPSAELADYILPIASWMERPGFFEASDTSFYGGEKALPSAVPGEYDHRTDYDIFKGLGIRLGQQDDWPWADLEETYDYMLEPMSMTFKQFMDKGGYHFPADSYKKYEKIGFATATEKVELASTVLEKLGYDPLPEFEEPFETPISRPDLVEEYPLMLITGGRFIAIYHSEHRQIEKARKRHPHPLVQIHPETAGKLGIADGDWVWIESLRGRIRMKCTLFKGIDPRVVHCEHGWWFPELPGEEPWLHGVWESNINVLTDDEPDHCNQKAGNWPLRTALCRVYKVKQY